MIEIIKEKLASYIVKKNIKEIFLYSNLSRNHLKIPSIS